MVDHAASQHGEALRVEALRVVDQLGLELFAVFGLHRIGE